MNINIIFSRLESTKNRGDRVFFCGKYQAQLNRHIKLKDSDNKEVKEALKLPKVLWIKIFDMLNINLIEIW